MAIRRVNNRNQITIPGALLKKIGTGRGEYFDIYERSSQIVLKPVTIAEKDETFTPDEWDKLEKLVSGEVERKAFTEYATPEKAKVHLRKQMKRK